MGIDISAFTKVTLVKASASSQELLRDPEYEKLYDADDHRWFHVEEVFKDAADGLQQGLYLVEDEQRGFSMSYSTYLQFRRELAVLVGRTFDAIIRDPQPGPFVELIYNSDCEGTIGPATAAKLAADFDEWHDRAMARLGAKSFYAESYRALQRLLHHASTPEGAVRIH